MPNLMKRLLLLFPATVLLLPAQPPPPGAVAWQNPHYRNLRAPLLETKFVRLPLGSIRPEGWLKRQFEVQANGLTGRLPEVWDAVAATGWKGDRRPWEVQAGYNKFEGVRRVTTYSGSDMVNMFPECCWSRFVPRWLEGLVPMAYMLDDPKLKARVDEYLKFLLAVEHPEHITPSITAWSHLGRVLPGYVEATGDRRALELCRRMLDYFDHIRGNNLSPQPEAVQQTRLGMPLSFTWWYYTETGDPAVLSKIKWIAKNCVDYYRDFYESERTPSQHIVDVTQSVQYPVMYYLLARDRSYVDAVYAGLRKLDVLHGQVGGRWNGDEYLSGLSPTQGSELCSVTEFVYSLVKNLEALGDPAFADRIESLVFNAVPGTCTGDWWAHQYDQQANQVLVSVAKRTWHGNNDQSNIFGFTPNYPCCLSNMHSPFPNYVQHLWLATADRGLVTMAYGPAVVRARVGDGREVTVRQETEYPFGDTVKLTVGTEAAVEFPLYFRIPAWAGAATLQVGDGAPTRPAAGSLVKVQRTWRNGDTVRLDFHPQVRTERRMNDAVAVLRGPLVFSLKIGQAFKKIKIKEDRRLETASPVGVVNWHIDPTTPWNYGLAIDPAKPGAEVVRGPIGDLPFARKDEPVWLPGATEFTPWTGDVPIALRMKARLVPTWGMKGASADAVPRSPVAVATPETTVELIPYGATRLRVSEFPVVAGAP